MISAPSSLLEPLHSVCRALKLAVTAAPYKYSLAFVPMGSMPSTFPLDPLPGRGLQHLNAEGAAGRAIDE